MPTIHILDKSVAELIAAGEVVERPASVVKELMENCIDAGADSIAVEIKGGGIGYIRVSDNGCGISPEDMPRAFLRHATSKVLTEDDLAEIATLGFRGEALASINAMAKVELISRVRGADEGARITAEGGEVSSVTPNGCPEGTTIIVRDLFYNTPARMKFLRRDTSEGNAVAGVVEKIALSHPEIAIRFIRDGQTKLSTSGGGDLPAIIAQVYGRTAAANLLRVDYAYEHKIRVTGYVGAPSSARPTRIAQCFFINNRYIRSTSCTAALEEAFKGKLTGKSFPVGVLNIEIAPSEVDVNVHPAKTQVRFSDDRPVFQSIYYAVKSALAPQGSGFRIQDYSDETVQDSNETARDFAPSRTKDDSPPQEPSTKEPPRLEYSSSPPPSRADAAHDPRKPLSFAAPRATATPIPTQIFDKFREAMLDITPEQPPQEPPKTTQLPEVVESPEVRLIGELFGTYILLELADDLLLVDKHAAHEGVLHQKIREQTKLGHRQVLLSPLTLNLPREEYAVLAENTAVLEDLGFLADDFGEGALILRELPILLHEADAGFMLSEIAGKLIENRMELTPSALDALCYSVACKSAIRARDKSSLPELREVVRMLEKSPEVTHCPHGRPILTRISKSKIDRMFGR